MSKVKLDLPKTYHELDPSDLYSDYIKFGRFFEKGYHESQFHNLPSDLKNIKNIIISTNGNSKHVALFLHSLTPFFAKLPIEICTSFRLPLYTNEETFIIFVSESESSKEVVSAIQESLVKKSPHILVSPSGELQREIEKNQGLHITSQGTAFIVGYLTGILARLNHVHDTLLNPQEISAQIEKIIAKLTKDAPEEQNPAKLLAQKHAQKANLIISYGHLQGVGEYLSSLLIVSSGAFSSSYTFPEVNNYLKNLFRFPVDLADKYQVIILGSDLYPQIIQKEIETAKEILGKSRIRFSLLKPESSDWFGQIFESLVFFTFFSYYLSIVNKANI